MANPQYTPRNPLREKGPTEQKARFLKKLQRLITPFFTFSLAAMAAIVLVVVIAVVMLFGWYSFFQTGSLILPGVWAGETDLGGLTLEEAAVLLHSQWNMQHKISVDNGLQSWSVQPAEIGLSLDAVQTARGAYEYGHGQSTLAEMAMLLASFFNGYPVEPTIDLNLDSTRLWLENLNETIRQEPVDARLIWDGQNFVPVPAALGYQLDVEKAIANIQSDPAAVFLGGYYYLPLIPLIPAINDLSETVSAAEHLISTPATFPVYDALSDQYTQFTIPREVLATWVLVSQDEEGPVVSFDEQRISAYLASEAGQLEGDRFIDGDKYNTAIVQALEDQTSITITASHPATTYQVNKGDTLLQIAWQVGMPFWKLIQANTGIDMDELYAGQELIVPSIDEMLPLPVVPHKRIKLSISKQRLWIYENGELLAKHVISTGIDRSPTQPGLFQVQTHEKSAYASVWDLTMPHFLGIYEAWPGFMNGIHGLPTLSNGQRLWGSILGRPASYGCIILDLKPAKDLYNWAEEGVVVEIVR